MSVKSISTSYTIPWCRDGEPVTKIIKISWTNCESITFSDWWTEILPSIWIEGLCDSAWAISTMWGRDFPCTTWATLAASIWVTEVRSITLIASSNCDVTISWMNKTLMAWSAYTWSQWDTTKLDITSFVFVSDWITIESIRENI